MRSPASLSLILPDIPSNDSAVLTTISLNDLVEFSSPWLKVLLLSRPSDAIQ